MNSIPCEFYGGPLAGQTHAVPYPPPPVYRVPSFSRARVNYDAPVAPLDHIALETEEYELGPGKDGSRYGYTWINPAESLRAEIKRLKDAVGTLNDEKRDLQQRVAELTGPAFNWNSLKSTLRELGLS